MNFAQNLIYHQSLALLTDLYQLTMVYGYWKAGIAEREAVFHLNFRRQPFQGGFALAAGLETAIWFMQSMKFNEPDLYYLSSLKDSRGSPLFEEKFLDFLRSFSFECDVDAFSEGTLVFPYEPILRVQGPIWQAQLMESPLLNLINFQTLIATKAARICIAAHPDSVIEFGMRRAQGIDGALSASRAAFIGGCSATSDVLAGKLFDIPVRGTQAHSWIMAFEEESCAFETFARIMPHHSMMLIDTYDSIIGVKKAIEVALRLKKEGFELSGVRLDSGDLAKLSVEIRKLLDQAGFQTTQIMASNELDEYVIRDLKQRGARINIWGVGTHLVTGKDQPALDGVYKLSAIRDDQGNWRDRLKLSEQLAKVTNPGILQVRRFFNGENYLGDAIYDELLGIQHPCTIVNQEEKNHVFQEASSEDLLKPILRKGKLVYQTPSLQDIRSHAQKELSRLPCSIKQITHPQSYCFGLEATLYEKKLQLIQALRNSK